MSSRTDPCADRPLAVALAKHYEEIKAFILRKVGCAELAADVTQDAWVKMATATPGEPIDNPRAYLYRVAGNLAVDRLRQTALRARLDADVAPEGAAATGLTPERVAAGRQEYAVLLAAVEELPEKCRAAFLLYRGRGMSMREVAETLDISPKTVEKHVARAMLHCRARLAAARGETGGKGGSAR
jgi:RNA polymerase sigma factor (sigma-70 family)